MTSRLYVGNLPYSVTEQDLRDWFSPMGEVSNVSIITDRETGRPKGFAFVEMADAEAAQKAINELNGQMMENRTISVAEARPQTPRYGGGGGGGYGGGGYGGGGYGGERGGSGERGRR